MTEVGRNPGRLISAWADFLGEHPAARPVRGIGEPVWFGRTTDEIAECQRHEALLNLAFADRRDFVVICPYDRTRLDESVLAEARSSHPLLVQDGETVLQHAVRPQRLAVRREPRRADRSRRVVGPDRAQPRRATPVGQR